MTVDVRPQARFVDPGAEPFVMEEQFWTPLVITRRELDEEIAKLAEAAVAPDDRRRLIVHPRSTSPGFGLTPGIQVTLEVLRPGERTAPRRHSSSGISFCIAGTGEALVGGRRVPFARYDTWTIPAFTTHVHVNTGDDVQVRLTYSNASLLEKLGVHWVDPSPPEAEGGVGEASPAERTAPTVRALGDGAYLMGYEDLINPPVVEQPPLHWSWEAVKSELDTLAGIDGTYDGRRLFLLYNPATGRTNGTTPALFATLTIRPPEIVDRPHRHAAAAINYFFQGSGWSRIGGRRYEWEAGDLVFTAPGWMVHNHASGPDPVYEITIQDFPFHLAMDSLMWQEDLKRPPRLLGSHSGFHTNRTA